ncbi:MAG: P-II family nitrogen regulator [Candidatus Sumerlaeota bacterium]
MYLIVAYIQPERLGAVKRALYEAGIYKMSALSALGCGQQGGLVEQYRGNAIEVNLLKKTRLEIAVNQEYLDAAVNAIIKGGQTGEIGDGKIFVLSLANCVRIRTGETENVAIG